MERSAWWGLSFPWHCVYISKFNLVGILYSSNSWTLWLGHCVYSFDHSVPSHCKYLVDISNLLLKISPQQTCFQTRSDTLISITIPWISVSSLWTFYPKFGFESHKAHSFSNRLLLCHGQLCMQKNFFLMYIMRLAWGLGFAVGLGLYSAG